MRARRKLRYAGSLTTRRPVLGRLGRVSGSRGTSIFSADFLTLGRMTIGSPISGLVRRASFKVSFGLLPTRSADFAGAFSQPARSDHEVALHELVRQLRHRAARDGSAS